MNIRNKLLIFMLSLVALLVIVGCVPPQQPVDVAEEGEEESGALAGEAVKTRSVKKAVAPAQKTQPVTDPAEILKTAEVITELEAGATISECEDHELGSNPTYGKINPFIGGALRLTTETFNSAKNKKETKQRVMYDTCDEGVLKEHRCNNGNVQTIKFTCSNFGLNCVKMPADRGGYYFGDFCS